MSVSPRWRPKAEMTWHPRSIPAGHRKSAGLKNDVSSMCSVERKYIDLAKPKSGALSLSPCISLDDTILVMSAN